MHDGKMRLVFLRWILMSIFVVLVVLGFAAVLHVFSYSDVFTRQCETVCEE